MCKRPLALRIAIVVCVCLCFGCGTEEDPNDGATANSAANATPNNAATNSDANSASNNMPGSNNAGDVGTITVGVFKREQDGVTYTNLNKDLVFQVGVTCQTWDRAVEMPSPMDSVQTPHQHYNAADAVSYQDDALTWTEYGPEHSQEEIDATCAAGVDGAEPKVVNSTDYFFDGNMGEMDEEGNYIGFYLKITSVE